MKGEFIRRMSLEMIKDEVVVADPYEKDKDKAEDEDDYILKTIGSFGLWQAVVSITVLLTRIIAAWNIFSSPLLTPVVDFVCVEFSDNVTTEVENSTCYENCSKYNYSSLVGKSIIEDFGLICQNAWLATFSHSVLLIGFMLGVLLLGWISDKFGRRKAMLISTFLSAVFMIALPFSPSYIIFTSIRFIIGVASGGATFICVVQVMEIIGKRYIEIAGLCVLIPVCLAQASLAGFAYFTSNWRGYTLSYGVASCLIFVITFFVPESPRWLVANGKDNEAVKIITSAAYRNKLDTSNIRAEITKALEDMKSKDCEILKVSYLDFFKSKAIIIPTLVIFILWFSLSMCFYEIYQYVIIVGLSPYYTVVILGLTPIPFLPLGIIINKQFGRKYSTIGTIMCVAVATIFLVFVSKGHWSEHVFGVIAFVSCNICWSISYVHVSEMYPTSIRNMGFGLASCGATLGSIIAPFVVNISPRWLPSLIFCMFAVLSGLCCSALPETKGQNLKDTMEK